MKGKKCFHLQLESWWLKMFVFQSHCILIFSLLNNDHSVLEETADVVMKLATSVLLYYIKMSVFISYIKNYIKMEGMV